MQLPSKKKASATSEISKRLKTRQMKTKALATSMTSKKHLKKKSRATARRMVSVTSEDSKKCQQKVLANGIKYLQVVETRLKNQIIAILLSKM